MKTVMILGAAAGQLPFINICKSRGYKVIVVSPEGDYPGFRIADEVVYADTTDKEYILQKASDYKIDAILTDQTDVSVPTVAYVSEKLNLNSIGYEKALDFSDKFRMRKAAKQCGVHVPEFYKACSRKEARELINGMNLPVIVKPTRSSGSRGVRKIDDKMNIDAAIDAAFFESKSGEIIIEQFIVGKEYLADGFVLDYNFINTDVGEKEYFDLDNKFVSKMCIFTSAGAELTDVEKKVLDTNKQLVEGMCLKYGITHAEYIYSEKDHEVYLVEVAARGGGVFLSSDITPRASGINTNELLIDYVVEGKKKNLKRIVLDNKVAAWRCFTLKEGYINSIEGVDKASSIPGVFGVKVEDLYVGKHMEAIKDDKGKYGPVLVEGKNKTDCYDVMGKVMDVLHVTTIDGNVVSQMIW